MTTTIKSFLECLTDDDRSITMLIVGSCICFGIWFLLVFEPMNRNDDKDMDNVENPEKQPDDPENPTESVKPEDSQKDIQQQPENLENSKKPEDRRGKWFFLTPFLAIPEIFFDITSASANWATKSGANRAHAIGSLVHGICAALKYHDTLKQNEQVRLDTNATLAGYTFLAEILELSSILSTLEGWRKGISATWLAIGAWAILNLYLDQDEPPGKDVNVFRRVVYGMQLIYVVIVFIAATEDWNRLLWLLPEIPFETISTLAPIV